MAGQCRSTQNITLLEFGCLLCSPKCSQYVLELMRSRFGRPYSRADKYTNHTPSFSFPLALSLSDIIPGPVSPIARRVRLEYARQLEFASELALFSPQHSRRGLRHRLVRSREAEEVSHYGSAGMEASDHKCARLGFGEVGRRKA